MGLAGVLTVWSVNYIVVKITLAHIAAVTLIPFRAELICSLLLAIYFAQPRASRTPLRARDVPTFAYLGFFGFVVNQGCFVLGLSYTTSQHSVVIIALGPVFILLLASGMKLEKLTLAKLLGMAISFAGVVVLETDARFPDEFASARRRSDHPCGTCWAFRCTPFSASGWRAPTIRFR